MSTSNSLETLQIFGPAGTVSSSKPAAASAQLFPWLGGGMILCGLLRGSWPGLALAGVGGMLLCHRSQAVRSGSRDAKTTGDPQQTVALPPRPFLPSQEHEGASFASYEPNPRSTVPAHDGELTLEEHAESKVVAYFRALQRGGGQLPPYEHAQADKDFCAAAEFVLNQRLGG